ncbi:MAG: trypsin-like peptidase domain-containing protein [Candidatus Sericytochromatia bacterium]|nr:trypsin-like peptidase domain-containing protein [Candidatus Sericytochromatia bacterium]
MKNKLFTALLITGTIIFQSTICQPVYALKSYELDMIRIYKQVSPSVVSVLTVSYENNEDAFMDPSPKQGAGSGVVIDKSGYILTNNHVVEGASKIDVAFGKKIYSARVIGVAPDNDLAILKVNAPANLLVPAKLADSSKLQVGQTAIAIGNPFGILGRTVTAGIVSALNRDVKIQGNIYRGMIQTDASINGGNSGGPLVNTDGQVIGINTLIFSQTGGSVGIGFSIPINVAKKFIPSMISKGRVTYPALGVSVLTINNELAIDLSLPTREGLLVLSAMPGGAAQKSGIKGANKIAIIGNAKIPVGGDIIVSLDGEKVTTLQDLSSYIETNKDVGSNIIVSVIRGRKVINFKVKLQARPSPKN